MQCSLMKISCCCLSPKIILTAFGFFGMGLGILSAFWPRRSIALYQWIMERINWKVVPIDEAREIRNTRTEGFALTALSLAIFFIAFSRF